MLWRRIGSWMFVAVACARFAGVQCALAGNVVPATTREELAAALREAKPGDEVRLAAGTYAGGLAQAGLRGTADDPIVIAAADPQSPPVIEGGGSGLHLSSPQHVEVRGLVFAGATGNGLNIDDGSKADTPARHVVLRDVVVRDVGPKGNTDGIKLSGVDDFLVTGCRVEQWGEGGSGIDMVGCHRGVIDHSHFVGRGGQQANAVQAKGGSSDVAIRSCRIENPGGRGVNVGGSTGLAYFRPADAAYEAKDILVEDCEFLGGEAAIAFVGVDGAVVRHNTIYRPRRWAIRILQENTDERFAPSRSGQFTRNLVAFRGDELRQIVNIGGGTAPDTFQFEGNAWICLDRPDATRRMVQLPVSEENGAYGEPPAFADPENGDLTIRNRADDDPGVRPPSIVR